MLLAFGYGCNVYALRGAAEVPEWPGVGIVSVIGDSTYIWPIGIVLIGVPLIFPNGGCSRQDGAWSSCLS